MSEKSIAALLAAMERLKGEGSEEGLFPVSDEVDQEEADAKALEGYDAAAEYGIDDSTIGGKAKAFLVNSGLFPEEADMIIEEFKKTDSGQTLRSAWNSAVDGYPPMMVNMTILGIKNQAKEWLGQNAPQHWARPMFD